MRLKLGSLLCVLIIFASPSSLLAQKQTASPTPTATKTTTSSPKNVVKNFKANLNDYSPFGSNCNLKPKGDANCDGAVNDFDLSVWQVEFNAANSPKRSDFNNDGAINLVDFGIWRGTVFPQKSSSVNSFFQKLASIFHFSASAQETPTSPVINSSQSFSSASGNSSVVNSLSGGNSQQVNFDAGGNAQSAFFYDTNGLSLAAASFLESGNIIISTEQSGIPISIVKTAAGPVAVRFNNPNGSFLATKSWPTQESYERNEPPLSVSLPGKDRNIVTLNIQPNGTGSLQRTDIKGNLLNLSQIQNTGYYGNYDAKTKISNESNPSLGFVNLKVPNLIGGRNNYLFFNNTLTSITQTDAQNNFWQAIPNSADSWDLIGVVNGKEVRKTVADPIKEVKSGTLSPNELINVWKYYLNNKAAAPEIDFATGFSVDSSVVNTQFSRVISKQVTKADEAYKIQQTPPPPNVLGIVKEAHAQQNSTGWQKGTSEGGGQQTFVDPANGQNYLSTNVGGTNGAGGTMEITFTSHKAGDPPNQVTSIAVTLDQSQYTQLQISPDTAFSSISQAGQVLQATGRKDDLSVPSGAYGTIEAPAGPADQPAPPAQQPGPVTKGGDPWDVDQRDPAQGGNSSQGVSSVKDQAAQAAGEATRGASSALEAANAARTEYSNAFDRAYSGTFQADIRNDASAMSFRDNQLSNVAIQSYATYTHPEMVNSQNQVISSLWNGSVGIDARNQAINALGLDVDQASVPPPGALTDAAPVPQAGGPPSTSAAPPPPSAYAPPPGFSGNVGPIGIIGGVGYTQTYNESTGDITARFTNGSVQVTHTSGDQAGSVSFSYGGDSVYSGTTVEIGPNGQISGFQNAELGSFTVGASELTNTGFALFDAAGNIVNDQGAIDYANSLIDVNNAVNGQDQNKIGSLLGDGSGTCFLRGTLISTPSGPIPIETLKPGDKVYSFNEKTRQKEISDFKNLDINFVDGYLIINGKINTTVYHPFYVVVGTGLKTIRADELKLGSILQDEQGNHVPVSSIERVSAPKTTVYNLMDVSPNNNFFAEGILVHNYGSDSSQGSESSGAGVDSNLSGVTDSSGSDGSGSSDSGSGVSSESSSNE